jgi:uncharacterized protein
MRGAGCGEFDRGFRQSPGVVRTVVSILLAGISTYVLLIACVYLFQSRLIYFPNVPGRILTATPGDLGLMFEAIWVTPADGTKLYGRYVSADAPAVLLCHGNAGNISQRWDWIDLFHQMGLSVLLFDCRGYGKSSGTPSEPGTHLDAEVAWDFLTTRMRLAPNRIVIVGELLGGPIAAPLARDVHPGALILVSTFISVPDLASKIHWYLPVRLLARFRYPTAEYVAHVSVPVLVIHSFQDEIVPFWHAEQIFGRAQEPKQLLRIVGDHNSAFSTSGPKLREGIRSFLTMHSIPAG